MVDNFTTAEVKLEETKKGARRSDPRGRAPRSRPGKPHATPKPTATPPVATQTIRPGPAVADKRKNAGSGSNSRRITFLPDSSTESATFADAILDPSTSANGRLANPNLKAKGGVTFIEPTPATPTVTPLLGPQNRALEPQVYKDAQGSEVDLNVFQTAKAAIVAAGVNALASTGLVDGLDGMSLSQFYDQSRRDSLKKKAENDVSFGRAMVDIISSALPGSAQLQDVLASAVVSSGAKLGLIKGLDPLVKGQEDLTDFNVLLLDVARPGTQKRLEKVFSNHPELTTVFQGGTMIVMPALAFEKFAATGAASLATRAGAALTEKTAEKFAGKAFEKAAFRAAEFTATHVLPRVTAGTALGGIGGGYGFLFGATNDQSDQYNSMWKAAKEGAYLGAVTGFGLGAWSPNLAPAIETLEKSFTFMSGGKQASAATPAPVPAPVPAAPVAAPAPAPVATSAPVPTPVPAAQPKVIEPAAKTNAATADSKKPASKIEVIDVTLGGTPQNARGYNAALRNHEPTGKPGIMRPRVRAERGQPMPNLTAEPAAAPRTEAASAPNAIGTVRSENTRAMNDSSFVTNGDTAAIAARAERTDAPRPGRANTRNTEGTREWGDARPQPSFRDATPAPEIQTLRADNASAQADAALAKRMGETPSVRHTPDAKARDADTPAVRLERPIPELLKPKPEAARTEASRLDAVEVVARSGDAEGPRINRANTEGTSSWGPARPQEGRPARPKSPESEQPRVNEARRTAGDLAQRMDETPPVRRKPDANARDADTPAVRLERPIPELLKPKPEAARTEASRLDAVEVVARSGDIEARRSADRPKTLRTDPQPMRRDHIPSGIRRPIVINTPLPATSLPRLGAAADPLMAGAASIPFQTAATDSRPAIPASPKPAVGAQSTSEGGSTVISGALGDGLAASGGALGAAGAGGAGPGTPGEGGSGPAGGEPGRSGDGATVGGTRGSDDLPKGEFIPHVEPAKVDCITTPAKCDLPDDRKDLSVEGVFKGVFTSVRGPGTREVTPTATGPRTSNAIRDGFRREIHSSPTKAGEDRGPIVIAPHNKYTPVMNALELGLR